MRECQKYPAHSWEPLVYSCNLVEVCLERREEREQKRLWNWEVTFSSISCIV